MRTILTIFSVLLLSFTSFSQGNWNTTLTYNIGFPVGNTTDFISQTSWRGIMIQGDYFVSDEFTVGFIFGLQTFYEELGRQTVTEGTITATGDQFNYLSSIPLLASGKYHFNRFGAITPHVGLGAGLYNMIQTVEFAGIQFESRNWQIGFMPNAGIGFELSPGTDFVIEAAYHNYLESKDIEAQSYFGLQVGLRWTP
jgi:hypothetical protein